MWTLSPADGSPRVTRTPFHSRPRIGAAAGGVTEESVVPPRVIRTLLCSVRKSTHSPSDAPASAHACAGSSPEPKLMP